MKNLYCKDEKLSKEVLQHEIMQRISDGNIKNLQYRINRYINLRAYESHREDSSQYFVSRVSEAVRQYMSFHDLHEEEFLASFIGSYQERLYEISQAEFLDKTTINSYQEKRRRRAKK